MPHPVVADFPQQKKQAKMWPNLAIERTHETIRRNARKGNASSRTSRRVVCPRFGGRTPLDSEKIIA
jgi:hypothetical protein